MEKFKNSSIGDKIFYIIITVILTLFFIAVLYPCIYVVSASISSGSAINAGKVVFLPVGFSLKSYEMILSDVDVWRSFLNSIFYTVVGTAFSVVMTVCAAYCLSRKDFPGGKIVMLMFTFVMLFSGGIIPHYLLVSNLGIRDTIWAVLLPGALSTHNLIVARSYIENSIPHELFESAMVDGCTDIGYFLRIVLPLSKSIIAVLVLFFGISRWNEYFRPMLYLQSRELYPLTLIVREYLVMGSMNASNIKDPEVAAQRTEMLAGLRYALIVISTAPIMMLYPFIQKYLVKGIMIGSVKG